MHTSDPSNPSKLLHARDTHDTHMRARAMQARLHARRAIDTHAHACASGAFSTKWNTDVHYANAIRRYTYVYACATRALLQARHTHGHMC